MLNHALLQVADFDSRCAPRWGQGEISVLSEISSQLRCSRSRTGLKLVQAELNSCSDLFPGPVRLPANRQPGFG